METKKKFNVTNLFKTNNGTLLIVLFLVIVTFTLSNKNYLSYNNMISILSAAASIGLFSIGQTYLIISGNVDLSVGSVGAITGVIVALLIKAGIFWPFAVIITLVIAAVIGLINSSLVNIFKLQPFIATLAMYSVIGGLAYVLSNGLPISVSDRNFIFLGVGKVLGVPIPIIILLMFFLIFGFILARTRFGRCVYMIGGNSQAAYLAGINNTKISTVLYMLSSVLAGFAGIIMAARMHVGAPTALTVLGFDSITIAVLGGVAFYGGIGNLLGVFIGLLLVQFFSNGLTVLGLSGYWHIVAKGLLLILALIADYFRSASKLKLDKRD